MRDKLCLKAQDPKLYLPQRAKIFAIHNLSPREKCLALELLDRPQLGHHPGQFLQVTVLGIGEAPISITSPPTNDNRFEISIRAVGEVTRKLCELQVGNLIYIRGPFGQGFNADIMQRMLGKHLLLIVGGIGYFPLRSLINKIIPERKKYKKISILYGCKTPTERMYPEELAELEKLGGNVELLETVDSPDIHWCKQRGVITTLIPQITFIPVNTIAIIVGPPIMYKFVLKELLAKNVPQHNIYMDLERRMKCGIGKCGHCQMEGLYVCQAGLVINYPAASGRGM